ncbi:MAG TPA: HigA family addiction module antitoxin [Casimicrobiaceae bacterium]|nr:HigA family addiction module antitoxin [Casimicrobiaceae bacterium]
MIPTHRISEHPGEILLSEFLEPLELSQQALALHLGVPVQRINELVKGRRGVTPEWAWMLGKAFKTGPEFWMNLQSAHELSKARAHAKDVKPIKSAG